jgi:hypothetical protein
MERDLQRLARAPHLPGGASHRIARQVGLIGRRRGLPNRRAID